ncbi:hypothetical protein CPB84DRAFT_1795773 [Gymnopilus junonius]|uniref:C2H2-type domain-containing protein n=1 Tax=Gymnopilus junonius TaxID=109634 RepID=A0A9P5TH09_GYMJU|nr:hypothetical protein CPB84DRAFT_1795773 [Gymnopilus junonius]
MPRASRKAKNVQPDPALPLASVAVAVSPEPSTSESSGVEDVSNMSELHGTGSFAVSASRPGSPMQVQPNAEGPETDDSVTCQWEDCGKVFTHLPTLIEHIHNEHIGVHKSNYTCEWTTCLRRGLPQTSRFALISHIRSHTGEKPFMCTLAECDKSFTRSDALAKHMRLQHHISPPAPGRGGSRKRKRGADDQTQGTATPVEPHTPSELGQENINDLSHDYFNTKNASKSGTTNGRQRKPPKPSPLQPQHTPSAEDAQAGEEEGYASSSSDALPPDLQARMDETTGLIMGKTPAKVMYLLMKAKHRYAMEQNTALADEFNLLRSEMQREKEEKEHTLDDLFQHSFGPEAEALSEMHYPPPEITHAEIPKPAFPGAGPSVSSPYDQGVAVTQNGRGR